MHAIRWRRRRPEPRSGAGGPDGDVFGRGVADFVVFGVAVGFGLYAAAATTTTAADRF